MRVSVCLFSLALYFAGTSQLVIAADRDDAPPSVDLASRRAHPPKYPESAVDQKQEGKLLMKVLVSESGKVLSIEIEQASPPEAAGIFGDSAKEAIAQWKYYPGIKAGKAYSGFVLEPLVFSLTTP